MKTDHFSFAYSIGNNFSQSIIAVSPFLVACKREMGEKVNKTSSLSPTKLDKSRITDSSGMFQLYFQVKGVTMK